MPSAVLHALDLCVLRGGVGGVVVAVVLAAEEEDSLVECVGNP
jgi:hypothetical protein